ncbi:protein DETOXIFICATION 53-like [Salvia miltiorrhiza]|uniref:protein DETOXIFICATION 53-like n=1 Tax=Salvia miltiorrhiza TaxID=226208 RepID=UPI0025AB6453|nr:protein DETOXIFICATION 53-like [Salvia miltiorrhiza]XP_057804312.1 protein DETOXIFICATION 53-like [Salvia miltiorrhiza]
MCKMSESRELELPDFNGGGGDDGGGDIKFDEISHDAMTAAEDRHRSFCCFFQRVPLNEVVEELLSLGKIACPVALTTLLYFSKTIISMLFLGHMEKAELAGGSLAVGFANVTGFSVMKGLCTGMDPICCQAYGARRWPVLTQTYLKTVVLLLVVTIPMAVLWLNVDTVFHRLGQDHTITKIAKNYLLFSLPELFTHANLVPLRTFLRTQGLNSPNTLVATCVSIMHLPVTYFLVTYLNLRVKGIALASVIYSVNMNLGLWIYLFFSKAAIKPWTGASLDSLFHGWRPLLGLALPSVCQVCLEWWWYEIILFLSGLLENPESCVAAMGILIQTTGTVYVFPFSLSLSISQRVGHELGAAQPARAQLAAMIGIMMAAGYGVTAFGLSVALRSRWGRLYTTEPQVLDMIASVLPILGLAELGNAPQTAACGALTGSARPKVGVWINIAAFYLVGLPCSAVMAFKLKKGFQGLWMGLVAAQAACMAMMLYNVSRTDWKHETKRAEELTMAAVGDKEDSAGANLVDGGA